MFTKGQILDEIKRTARENGGTPLGIARFESETGIKAADWVGRFWSRWGDALLEAGFQPNALQGPRTEDELLESLSSLARELSHFPVANEIKLKARSEPGFPWHNTFARFGNKAALVKKLREFAGSRGYLDVVAICEAATHPERSADLSEAAGQADAQVGFVYLLKSGRYWKIGRSNAVGRRERELAIQLPEEA